MAIENANHETGGSVIEMAEAEYMVRVHGYIQGEKDLRAVPLGVTSSGAPIRLEHIADIRLGPEMRRGIAELNGEGEVAGGIIVMRHGENALATINAVKARLESLKKTLPAGVEIVPTYDRSAIIERAVGNLRGTLIEEFIVVALVCLAFLFHLRSSLVVVITLPIGILVSFIVMKHQGINANIMSLGGIAIAIGAMVDAAIVMIENVHKHMEKETVTDKNRWAIISAGHRGAGSAAVLLAAHHHPQLSAGVRARGAGRPAVRAARLHQDLRHGRGRGAVDHAGAGAHGLFHPRAHPRRTGKPAEPLAHQCLPAAAERRAGAARDRTMGIGAAGPDQPAIR